MDTRTSADLKKAIEALENEKKEMSQRMRLMQAQIEELTVSGRKSGAGGGSDYDENETPVDRRLPNDIKVDIPEYEGRLDSDEFVEWLNTVERVFDYKQTSEENKVKVVALKLRKHLSAW
ncbi:hypothetical protein QVD17_21133 [Tagetes erecta]|uniref:Uncharacterized protein n=1 Tax=Tagetes erecta TaxID=13708 RepID=A0AAD8NRM2_TARER|nr:hypothetical protein QVD17_21133 [Tagetes erecta]